MVAKVVTHVGKKVRLEDGEVIDFLRRAQASGVIRHISYPNRNILPVVCDMDNYLS